MRKLLVALLKAVILFAMGAFMLFCGAILAVEAGFLVQAGLVLAGMSMIVMAIGILIQSEQYV